MNKFFAVFTEEESLSNQYVTFAAVTHLFFNVHNHDKYYIGATGWFLNSGSYKAITKIVSFDIKEYSEASK